MVAPSNWLALALVFTAIRSSPALACSSCGSGGDDPLILYPTDNMRIYLGTSSSKFSHNLGPKGEKRQVYGVRERQRSVVSLGQRLTKKSFITLSLPHVTNTSEENSRTGMGDPSLSFRYTALRQNFLNPKRPQIQFLMGYKPTMTTSTYDAKDQRQYLDAYGTGHENYRVGIDVWSGMNSVKYGFGYNFVLQSEEKYYDFNIQPGSSHQINATVGYSWKQFLAVTGIVKTIKSAKQQDSVTVEGSGSTQHSYFLTTSFRPFPAHELRGTFVQSGRFFSNTNTAAATSLTAAYIVSI